MSKTKSNREGILKNARAVNKHQKSSTSEAVFLRWLKRSHNFVLKGLNHVCYKHTTNKQTNK